MTDSALSKSMPSAAIFDIAIIGAGVVGCAIARRFAIEGARLLVIDKATDILDGASKGNSGLLHTGFDAPTGSLEQRCVAAGYAEYQQIHHDLKLPLWYAGALLIAWNRDELARIDAIEAQALANGVVSVARLTAAELSKVEPELAPGALGGLAIPGEAVIDPWTAPYRYLLDALERGSVLATETELLSARWDQSVWRLGTTRGPIHAKTVINCAGLYGDRVDRILGQTARFTVRPRKGQFLVYDKMAASRVRSILLPVPNAKSKGVIVCPTSFGNVLVGPTAEDQLDRENASVDQPTLLRLRTEGERIVPALKRIPIIANYAGLRPATEHQDYCIQAYPHQRHISVNGIRSTGLSSALGIARYVYDLYRDFAFALPKPQRRSRRVKPLTPLPPLAEQEPRDWRHPGHGGIICHCELVTRREINHALTGRIPARSLGALKRRTRVTMGRCQGFYCLAALSELTAGRFRDPIAPYDDP